MVPVETTTSFGAPGGGFASQALRSGSIARQPAWPGFQNSKSVGAPRNVARSTGEPARSTSFTAGTGSPILTIGGGGAGAGALFAPSVAVPACAAAGAGAGSPSCLRHERADGVETDGQRAADRAVRAHEHSGWGRFGLIGLSHLAVLLEEEAGQPVFGGPGAVGLGTTAADDGDGERLGMLALPAGDIGQERSAGAAAGVHEDQQDG